MSAEESLVSAVWEDERERVWNEAREHFGHRALIEQAKGMLMIAYGVDADEAFDVLRSQSQHYNVKLRVVAEQILKDMVELARATKPPRLLAVDGLAAHKR